jgi:peptidoglycan/LPS O-acetylase OafA/YrhL
MSTARRVQAKKEISLEALRGLAAIVVVFWHSCCAFLPEHAGIDPRYDGLSWQGSPFFVFLNGQSSVTLFFVLSGYVLTRRYFFTEQLTELVRGAIKRWPRFIGPVFVTIVASYLLFRLNLYSFAEAGKQSGSSWLAEFGWEFSVIPDITLWRAVKEGTYAVFFREEALFDTSLWTMHIEMIGSFIAFGMAPILAEAKKITYWAVFLFSACVILIANSGMPTLVAFPVGVTIAAILPQNCKIPKALTYGLLVAAIYLLGFSGKYIGIYSALKIFSISDRYASYPAVAGAAILICLFELYEPIKQTFSGAFSRWLGEFSFPIYLVHALLIFSLGSAVYIRYGTIAAFASVLVATPIAAFPILLFDRRWVSIVNRATRRFIQRSPAETLSTYPEGRGPGTRPAQRT